MNRLETARLQGRLRRLAMPSVLWQEAPRSLDARQMLQ